MIILFQFLLRVINYQKVIKFYIINNNYNNQLYNLDNNVHFFLSFNLHSFF